MTAVVGVLNVVLANMSAVLNLAVNGSNSSWKNSNCSFVKSSLTSMADDYPNLKSNMNMICLIFLGIVVCILLINLADCLSSQFRIADELYYKEWEDLKHQTHQAEKAEEHAKNNPGATDGVTPLQTAKAVPVTSGTEIVAGVPTVGGGNRPLKMVKKVAPSSQKYNSNYFAPKTKPNQVKPAEIERALDDMRANGKKRLRICDIDDKMINNYRDRGMLTEFQKPLRNFMKSDENSDKTSIKTATGKKK